MPSGGGRPSLILGTRVNCWRGVKKKTLQGRRGTAKNVVCGGSDVGLEL
jgi:hypothetical protein